MFCLIRVVGIPVDRLINEAVKYLNNAYSPYSGIKVASIVFTDRNNIYSGVNVENSSYGLTICAERVALTSMVTNGERNPLAIVIVSNQTKPLKPCGACRQFIAEFNPDTLVISHSTTSNRTEIYYLREIFPDPFKI